MTEINDNANIVEALRSKVEESDIKKYLKSTLGGYTKSSVLEYLNLLRKQQQVTQDTFARNQQQLFDEKENLRKANDALKLKLERAENHYCELSDSIKVHNIENSDMTPSDIAALKSEISRLRDELNNSDRDKTLMEKQLEHQKSSYEDLSQKLEHSEKEKHSLKELVKAEAQKERELSCVNSRLSGTIAEKEEEISFLNALLSEGQVSELKSKVKELTEQLFSQGEMLVTYNSEISLKQQTIEALESENEALNQRVSELKRNCEELSRQSIKHLASCKALTQQLESEYKRSISLIKERSAITISRLEAEKKLDETDSKLTLLELQLKKQEGTADTDAVYESANKTEKLSSEYEDTFTAQETCS